MAEYTIAKIVTPSGDICHLKNTTYTLTQNSNDGHQLTFTGSNGSTVTITTLDTHLGFYLDSNGDLCYD